MSNNERINPRRTIRKQDPFKIELALTPKQEEEYKETMKTLGLDSEYNAILKQEKEEQLKEENKRIEALRNFVRTKILTATDTNSLSYMISKEINRIEDEGHSFEIQYSTVVLNRTLKRFNSYQDDSVKIYKPEGYLVEYSALIIEYKRNPRLPL